MTAAGDLLKTVVAAARRAADVRAGSTPAGVLDRAIAARAPNAAAFESRLAQAGVRVIAECKRRSPSRGVLRADYDPAAIAAGYAAAGAAAISVLTEPTFFDGSLDHLRAVRAAVDIPLLRKDFIVTRFQIDEAAAAGADAVLLIVAALDDSALRDLHAHARAVGLAVLVEVHDAEELRRTADLGATVIGVNSRNLKTLDVSTSTFDSLARLLPRDAVAVAESGLKSPAELTRLAALGYRAFLMGERFMTAADPEAALAAFVRTGEAARS
jgi:indole-3-glycerol phosphate synthase